jgi:CHAD domain-containing protein/HD superfamily phosphodiesterase
LNSVAKTTGLRYWMARVLEECDHVSADFNADPVHDLRVALRRCRSLADGMMAMDPDRDWKAMKKAGKRLFQRLGDLRDVQIMMEWIEKLEPSTANVGAGDSPALQQAAQHSADSAYAAPSTDSAYNNQHNPVAHALLEILQTRESEQKPEARAALDEFDRKQWCQWSQSLPLRAARIRPGSAVFKHLALERWTAARELHTRALRNRSQVAFHTLRIGIKRFRYIVENFLPDQHKAWSKGLKHMQDLLGEVHDLDVLWSTALSCHVFPDETSRNLWHARIAEERAKRIEEYRRRTAGPDSLWNVWRAGLPQGKHIQEIATRRMKMWAKALDPDFAHSERVARLALELYDGLNAAELLDSVKNKRVPYVSPPLRDVGGLRASKSESRTADLNGDSAHARACLYLAAVLHDVGKSRGNKGHHKESLALIKAHGTPLGWKAENMALAAIVARFHCGALPTRNHKALRDLLPDEQKITIQLAAILRLANALDAAHNGHIRRVRIENAHAQSNHRNRRTNGFLRKPAKLAPNEALVIAAEGFVAGSPTAQAVAAERYLLETVLRRPVVVKAMKNAITWPAGASGKTQPRQRTRF